MADELTDLVSRVPTSDPTPDEQAAAFAKAVPTSDPFGVKPAESPSRSVLDYARLLSRGLVSNLVTAPGQLAKMAGGSPETLEAGQRMEKRVTDSLSPGGQAVERDPTFLQQVVGSVVESAPSMVVAAGMGGPVSNYLKAKGAAEAASRTATALGASERVAGMAAKAPEALAFGAAEGLQAGMMNAAQTGQQIREMPLDTLAQNPAFVEALLATDKNLPAEQRIALARNQMADAAESEVALRTGVSTGAIGAATGGAALPLLSKVLRREIVEKPGESALKTFAKAGLTEAGQEAPQSAAEQLIQNIATKNYGDPNQDVLEGVGTAALVGGISGGVLGGGVGTVAAFANRRRPEEKLADPNVGPLEKGTAAGQLSGAIPTDPATGGPIDAPPPPPPDAGGEPPSGPKKGDYAGEGKKWSGEAYGPGDTTNPVTGERIPAGQEVPPSASRPDQPQLNPEDVLTDADRWAARDQAIAELAQAGVEATDEAITERAIQILEPLAIERMAAQQTPE
ncbi:MAG: hypothetical protein ACM3H9_00135, partial [Rhodospirillaceae bacterium]